MESFTVRHAVADPLGGTRAAAIVGVVASGNLEVLAERNVAGDECVIVVETAATGFRALWEAVAADFVERARPGGVRFSINDGGARPDTVMLRLLQAARALADGA